jgi:hypothetical protein
VLVAADPTLGDWAAVGGAVFTAFAAGAAWLTARQGRQVIEASERPVVVAQVLRDTDGMLRLALINSGRGVARTVYFMVHAGGKATWNFVGGDGYLEPGERAHASTLIPLPEAGPIKGDVPDLAVMVSWRDAEGFVHYRTHTEAEHVPRTRLRRRPKYPERTELFKTLYPHVDWESAEIVPNAIEKL